MDTRIIEIAERIRGLRSILDITVEDAAKATGVAPESYAEVKELGFNCVQSFTSQMEVADGCRKAEELALAVLVEPRGGWKDAANGAHFASDNYDGSETIQVDFCGDVDPETDYTLNSDWTDDTFAKNQGNTVATTSSLTASHHVANVEGTGTTDYDDEDDDDDDAS